MRIDVEKLGSPRSVDHPKWVGPWLKVKTMDEFTRAYADFKQRVIVFRGGAIEEIGEVRMKTKIFAEGAGELQAEILEEKNPKTARAIWEALPIVGKANRWGDEIYFEISVKLEEENAQLDVEVGDIAYWPPGNALCIFFGRTPVSRGEKPRAYSPVNVFGRVIGDPKILLKVKSGELIKIERLG